VHLNTVRVLFLCSRSSPPKDAPGTVGEGGARKGKKRALESGEERGGAQRSRWEEEDVSEDEENVQTAGKEEGE
jgi:hypothetical protein